MIGWLVPVLSNTPSVDATEMHESSMYRFVGDIQPALCQKLFNIAKAEGEASMHPDRQLNDLWWKSITVIERILHAVVRIIRLAAG